jgi:Uncharacterized alpha/beta hydrolase domain (DUF2235)
VNTELPRIFQLWSEGHPENEDLSRDMSEWNADDIRKSELKGICKRLFDNLELYRSIKIAAYAAWDTVKSLGVPWSIFSKPKEPFHFVNEQLPSTIERAYHALALDERRYHFQPIILTSSHPERLKQCWFLGSHGDIGGGCDNEGLANVSLCWMISQLKEHVKFNQKACWATTDAGSILQLNTAQGDGDIMRVMLYNSLQGYWKFGPTEERSVGEKLRNHESFKSNETIHFSVHLLDDIVARQQGRSRSRPLEKFDWPTTEPHIWKATRDNNRHLDVSEDIKDRYETGMLNRWVGREIGFGPDIHRGLQEHLRGMQTAEMEVPLEDGEELDYNEELDRLKITS